MINSSSLKSKIKNISKNRNLSASEVLQMYLFERFLERLSKSKYINHFVIKGGLLISWMIGIDNRTTKDMDVTIKSLLLKEDIVKNMITEILSIDVGDNIIFNLNGVSEIRETDKYENFRVSISAKFGKINNVLKIDLTTGDIITPNEIEFKYKCMFKDDYINVLAYPAETIISEKYETIISRNITTTRMRDFYDLYSIYKLKEEELDFEILKKAILSTAKRRDSITFFDETLDIINDIRESVDLKNLWSDYLRDNQYIEKIDFLETVKILEKIYNKTTK